MVARSYWHGTTARRWEYIQKKGLTERSSVANSLYLPVLFGCDRAERESDNVVILQFCAPKEFFIEAKSGPSAYAAGHGQGTTYLNIQKIPSANMKVVDEISYKEAMELLRSKRLGQAYRKHLRQRNLESLMQNWR